LFTHGAKNLAQARRLNDELLAVVAAGTWGGLGVVFAR